MTEQVAKAGEAVVQAPVPKKTKGQRGRPPGSKNRNRRDVELSPSLRFLQEHIKSLLKQIGDACKVVYFIFDGELGHNGRRQPIVRNGPRLSRLTLPEHARGVCSPAVAPGDGSPACTVQND